MKKIFVTLVTIMIILVALYSIDRFSYSKEYRNCSIELRENRDSLLTVGIIGDSWVAGGRLDSIVHKILLDNGIENKVFSSGEPGAETKKIYKNMFGTAKYILESQPKYCIIIAGVNDVAGRFGKKFYTHHEIMMIKNILSYGVTPVILELPEFGVSETAQNLGVIQRYRNYLFNFFISGGDDIKSYRNQLQKELAEQNLMDKIVFIPFEICSNYKNCKELYTNPSHLSREGNKLLGELIARHIIDQKR